MLHILDNPSKQPIQSTLRGQTVQWIEAKLIACKSLESTDKTCSLVLSLVPQRTNIASSSGFHNCLRSPQIGSGFSKFKRIRINDCGISLRFADHALGCRFCEEYFFENLNFFGFRILRILPNFSSFGGESANFYVDQQNRQFFFTSLNDTVF